MRGECSRRGFVVAAAAVVLAGCATTPTLVAASQGETWPELETLLSVEAKGEVVTIRVRSQGCAAKADFVFRVDRWDDHVVVAFARRRLETCRGPATTAEIAFDYAELGLKAGERIVIANPVLSRP